MMESITALLELIRDEFFFPSLSFFEFKITFFYVCELFCPLIHVCLLHFTSGMSGPSLGIQRWQNLALFIQEMIMLTISLSDAFATSKIDDDHGVGDNDDEDDVNDDDQAQRVAAMLAEVLKQEPSQVHGPESIVITYLLNRNFIRDHRKGHAPLSSCM